MYSLQRRLNVCTQVNSLCLQQSRFLFEKFRKTAAAGATARDFNSVARFLQGLTAKISQNYGKMYKTTAPKIFDP